MATSAIPRDVAAMSGYGSSAAAGPVQHQWSPYVMNSGTVMAICGKDFAVIAGDTRMSVGYQIQSRNVGKLVKVTDKAVLGTGGHCQADTLNLQKMLRARMIQYEHQNGKSAKTSAIAQQISQMLYNRRFFPLLTKNIVAGLDEDGARPRASARWRSLRITVARRSCPTVRTLTLPCVPLSARLPCPRALACDPPPTGVGCVYTFDVVGCLERVRVACDGSAEELIQPVLDNLLERQHQQDKPKPPVLHVDYNKEEVRAPLLVVVVVVLSLRLCLLRL
jgi:20S proteasome subunit beta 6